MAKMNETAFVSITGAIAVLFLVHNAFALTQTQRDAVQKVLRNQNRRDWSITPAQQNATDLKYLGDDAIPLLAEFLSNYDLGYISAETMLIIDPNRAAPFLFGSMPKSDRNVQRNVFHT